MESISKEKKPFGQEAFMQRQYDRACKKADATESIKGKVGIKLCDAEGCNLILPKSLRLRKVHYLTHRFLTKKDKF